jgi:glycosyltransferase involved in cell wall biosynthesis
MSEEVLSISAPPASPPLRALYVHHVGILGGSSRSLYELLRGFPKDTVAPHYVGPKGKLVEMLGSLGIPVENCRGISQFDNCAYSYYRGLRWIILLREVLLLLPTYLALARARDRWGRFEVVHINDITTPFVAWLAKVLFPESVVVVHARAVQRTAETRRKRWLRNLYLKCADAVVAINENVSESLPDGLPVHVIHNGIAVPADADAILEKTHRPFSAAMVGVLARAKGCPDFLEAAAICRDRGYDIRFLLIGGGLRSANGWRDRVLQWLNFKEDIGTEMSLLIARLGLESIVVFRPFTTDLASIYREIDVLCFPSYLDAPGRPIFEAGFFGVPSIAAISRPKADTFVAGETGLLVEPGDPEALATAIMSLHDHPEDRKRMGAAARRMAHQRFDARENAREMLSLYRRLRDARFAAAGQCQSGAGA